MIKHHLFLCTLLTCALSAAYGHPDGTYIIDIDIQPENIRTRVDVNSIDMLRAVSGKILGDHSEEEKRKFPWKMVSYLETRINMAVDGTHLSNPGIQSWEHTDVSGENRGDTARSVSDTLLLDQPVYVVNLSWKKRADACDLVVSSDLFAEIYRQAMSLIRISWRGRNVRSEYLAPGNSLQICIHPDSLDAVLAGMENIGKMGKSGSSTARFLNLGFIHVFQQGYVNILFVLGLFLFSLRTRSLLVQAVVMSLAHTMGSGLAVFGIFGLPSGIVDPLLALSVCLVALENAVAGGDVSLRQVKSWRWGAILLFGLLQGLGIGDDFLNFGVSAGRFASALAAFNLGLALGLLAVVAAAWPAVFAFRKKTWYVRGVAAPASLVIAAAGLYLAVQRVFFP